MKKMIGKKNFLIVSSSLALVLFFQNCGPGFETVSVEGFSTELTSSIPVAIGSSQQNPFTCATPDSLSTKPILRLSKTQYSNTLLNLVGSQTHALAQGLINSLYGDTLRKSAKDFINPISDTQLSAYQSIAELVYNSIQSNPTVAQNIAGTCIQQVPVTALCRETFLKAIGLKAFRRPLEAAEIKKWDTQVFALGESGAESVALVTYGMMMSPHFLLRNELGEANSPTQNVFDLTPYEVASRLSYELTDSPPDQSLLDAAATNQLSSTTQLKFHVDRLINSPLGRAKVVSFFNYWLDPQRYSPSVFAVDFLQGLDVISLNDEFARELDEYIEYMVFTKNASFEELLTSRESFARTPAAAMVYGHNPVAPGSSPALTSSERKGIFMRGSVLATEGNETHPILRGVKVRTRYLCEILGLPAGVMTNDPTFFSDSARTRLSTRDRTEGITAGASCMGCHALINPAGFAFENFDGLGRIRNIEKAFSTSGNILAQHPIVTDSDRVFVGGAKVTSIRDGIDLIESMLKENQLPACFLRQSNRFFKVQTETADDGCVLKDAYSKLIPATDTQAPLIEALKNSYIHASVLKRRLQ